MILIWVTCSANVLVFFLRDKEALGSDESSGEGGRGHPGVPSEIHRLLALHHSREYAY